MSHRRPLAAAFIALLLWCCAPDTDEVCDFPVSASDDVAWSESFLGMSPAEEAAVVRLQGTVGDQLSTCSGTLVQADLVLTAAHCEETAVAPDAEVEVDGTTVRVTNVSAHDSLDLMFVTIDPPSSSGLLELAGELDESFVGQRAVAAGYGRTQQAAAGVRHFSVQEISSLDDARLSVVPVGTQGLCSGDSGGPLIIAHSGSVRVAGVLSTVSANCSGRAQFTAIDQARDWLAARGVAPSQAIPTTRECADRCTSDVALRCTAGSTQPRDCARCDADCVMSSATARAECVARDGSTIANR